MADDHRFHPEAAVAAPAGASRAAWLRAQVAAALRAATSGDPRAAELALAVAPAITGPGHALDRALVHVARAVRCALDGAPADDDVACALREAAGERIDPGVILEHIRALGDVLVVTGPDRRYLAHAAALALPADTAVIDARRDELVIAGQRRSLHRHPVRRRLLYALAAQPGRALGKDALVGAAWGCTYDADRHDDTLKSNMLYLRRMLAGTGLAIACAHPGYRFAPEARFAYVRAFDLFAASPRAPSVTARRARS